MLDLFRILDPLAFRTDDELVELERLAPRSRVLELYRADQAAQASPRRRRTFITPRQVDAELARADELEHAFERLRKAIRARLERPS